MPDLPLILVKEVESVMCSRNFEKEPYGILCFGDSNTWGCIPRWEDSEEPSKRHPRGVRWTSVLQERLGERVQVIEEGMGGRTTVRELPNPNGEGPFKVGKSFLPVCLITHRPLDMVILMLGTNDLHQPICPAEEELGDGVRELIRIIDAYPKTWRDGRRPRILLVAPPCLKKAEGRREVWKLFGEEGLRLSHLFGTVYRQVAQETGVDFLDAGDYIQPSDADGVHLTAEAHMRLGNAIAEKVRQMLPEFLCHT